MCYHGKNSSESSESDLRSDRCKTDEDSEYLFLMSKTENQLYQKRKTSSVDQGIFPLSVPPNDDYVTCPQVVTNHANIDNDQIPNHSKRSYAEPSPNKSSRANSETTFFPLSLEYGYNSTYPLPDIYRMNSGASGPNNCSKVNLSSPLSMECHDGHKDDHKIAAHHHSEGSLHQPYQINNQGSNALMPDIANFFSTSHPLSIEKRSAGGVLREVDTSNLESDEQPPTAKFLASSFIPEREEQELNCARIGYEETEHARKCCFRRHKVLKEDSLSCPSNLRNTSEDRLPRDKMHPVVTGRGLPIRCDVLHRPLLKKFLEGSNTPFMSRFAMAVMCEMEVALFSENDRKGNRTGTPLGFKGLTCRYCNGARSFTGRYFPTSLKSFAEPEKSLLTINRHLRSCKHCPESVKLKLSRLLNHHREEVQMHSRKYGGQRAFYRHIWNYLHPDQK